MISDRTVLGKAGKGGQGDLGQRQLQGSQSATLLRTRSSHSDRMLWYCRMSVWRYVTDDRCACMVFRSIFLVDGFEQARNMQRNEGQCLEKGAFCSNICKRLSAVSTSDRLWDEVVKVKSCKKHAQGSCQQIYRLDLCRSPFHGALLEGGMAEWPSGQMKDQALQMANRPQV